MSERVTVKDAGTIAGIGYRHDPDHKAGLNFITGFMPDYLERMKASGNDLPATDEEYEAVADVERRVRRELTEKLGREPLSHEVMAASVGQPIPSVSAKTIGEWVERHRREMEASSATE